MGIAIISVSLNLKRKAHDLDGNWSMRLYGWCHSAGERGQCEASGCWDDGKEVGGYQSSPLALSFCPGIWYSSIYPVFAEYMKILFVLRIQVLRVPMPKKLAAMERRDKDTVTVCFPVL